MVKCLDGATLCRMEEPLAALTAERDRHAAAVARWETERERLILAARAAGHTWAAIATAAGMSRAGTINAHNIAAARRTH